MVWHFQKKIIKYQIKTVETDSVNVFRMLTLTKIGVVWEHLLDKEKNTTSREKQKNTHPSHLITEVKRRSKRGVLLIQSHTGVITQTDSPWFPHGSSVGCTP